MTARYRTNDHGCITEYVDETSGITYTYTYGADGKTLSGISGDDGFGWSGSRTDTSAGSETVSSYNIYDSYTLGTETADVSYSFHSGSENSTQTGTTVLMTGDTLSETGDRNGETSAYAIGRDGNTVCYMEQSAGALSTDITYGDGTGLVYRYDANGNITGVSTKNSAGEETALYAYSYDAMEQLTVEEDAETGTATVYAYDANGNITGSTVYDLATGGRQSGIPEETHTWTYGNASWRDELTAYDGQSITYDDAGNPLCYLGKTLTWTMGRQLDSVSGQGKQTVYTYNDSGIRTGKTVTDSTTGTVEQTRYYLDDTRVIAEKKTVTEADGTGTEDTVWYVYSGNGDLMGFRYGGNDYYYRKNLQGDITGIYDSAGVLTVTYSYDAWGTLTGMTDSSGEGTAQINPFRYRGYYQDEETGWYYLQSRYYNAEVHRFLNADDVDYLGSENLACNLFGYCRNNSINNSDYYGNWANAWWNCRKVVSFALNTIISLILTSVFGISRNAFLKLADSVKYKYLRGPNFIPTMLRRIKKIQYIGLKLAAFVSKKTSLIYDAIALFWNPGAWIFDFLDNSEKNHLLRGNGYINSVLSYS